MLDDFFRSWKICEISPKIAAWSGDEFISVLMDGGALEISFLYNTALFSISLHGIALLVLSHCHDDHGGSSW